jgi:hypothetical protein
MFVYIIRDIDGTIASASKVQSLVAGAGETRVTATRYYPPGKYRYLSDAFVAYTDDELATAKAAIDADIATSDAARATDIARIKALAPNQTAEIKEIIEALGRLMNLDFGP